MSAVTEIDTYAALVSEVALTFEGLGLFRLEFERLEGKVCEITGDSFGDFVEMTDNCRVTLHDGFPLVNVVKVKTSAQRHDVAVEEAATVATSAPMLATAVVDSSKDNVVHSAMHDMPHITSVTDTAEADEARPSSPPPPLMRAEEAPPAQAADTNVSSAPVSQAPPPLPLPPSPAVGSLEIVVSSAKGLADRDGIGMGLSDPYAVIELEGFKAQETAVIDGSCAPVWDYVAAYDLPSGAKDLLLKLTVLDSDPVGSDHLGSCEVVVSKQLQEKALGKEVKISSQLKDAEGKTGAGVILVKINALPAAPEPGPAPKAKGSSAPQPIPEGFVCPDIMEVTVMKAIDLIDMDGLGESDPYVSVEMAGQRTATTPVMDGTLRPVWDYQVTYELEGKSNHIMKLTVFDADPVGADFLGYAEVEVTPCLLAKAMAKPQRLAIHLTPRPGNAEDENWMRENGGENKQGKLFVSISTVSAPGLQQSDPKEKLPSTGPVPDLLSLTIAKATHLASMDTFGSSDPYVVVECPLFPPQQTPVISGSLDPVWGHLMSYDFPVDTTFPVTFKFSLLDSDVKGNDELGMCTLEVTEALLCSAFGKKRQFALNVMREGKKQGKLFVSAGTAHSSTAKEETGPVTGPCPDLMEVTVQRATALIDRDSFGESDPFVSLSIKGFPEYQTPVVDGTLSPEWNYKALYELKGKDAHTLCLTVQDSDPVGADFLGYAELTVTPYMLRRAVKKPQELSVKLGPRAGNASDAEWVKSLDDSKLGRVFLTLSAVPRAPSTKTGPPQWWTIHIVKATGLVNADMLGTSDPFVLMQIEGQQDQQSGVADGTTEPTWGEEFACEMCFGETVNFTVFDEDTAGKDFLGHGTVLITEKLLAAGEKGEKITMNLKPRNGNKKDAKLAKKHDGNLGQLHITVSPSMHAAREVKQKAATKAAKPTPKPTPTPTPTPTPKPAPKPAAEKPVDPPTPPKNETADMKDLPPLRDAEAEALKLLLEINPMARSQAASFVGKEWKSWSWQQRLVVARQVELGITPDTNFLVSPMRSSYKATLSDPAYSTQVVDEEERSLEARFERLWGNGTKPRPPSPSHIETIIAERKRQALRDLEEERLARKAM